MMQLDTVELKVKAASKFMLAQSLIVKVHARAHS
jgi:hypothetical protein